MDENDISLIMAVGEDELCDSILNGLKSARTIVRCVRDINEEDALLKELPTNSHGFDVVVLDWDAANWDMAEAAEKLRGTLSPQGFFVAASSLSWEEIMEDCQAAGVQAYVQKPFFLSNFKHTVQTFKQSSALSAYGENDGALSGKLFLVAEDNELNSEILTELMDMKGAKCDIAENGKIALDKFINSPPDKYTAILMDVQMPVMNGYEAARKIRASGHPRAATIPIIAMTANTFVDDVHEALESGMNAHVPKPLDIDKLEAVIKKYSQEN